MVLYHRNDGHAPHHPAPNQLEPQLQPLPGRLARVGRLQAALQPRLVLPREPRYILHRPNRRHAGQRLGKVGVDGRQRDGADAFELARGGPIAALDVEVDDGEGEEEEADEWEGVDGDDDGANDPEQVCEEDVEDEGQAVVHRVQVAGKPAHQQKIGTYLFLFTHKKNFKYFDS